ncbi:hypothetical protein ACTPOK_09180 [Streptomyces inhibens]|uniref:hypothetical protein n=1 Tax=Streptomyces inhibens TaxID=2293571 RepID=UPI00402ABFC6
MTCTPSVWVSVATFATSRSAALDSWHPELVRLVCTVISSAWLVGLLMQRSARRRAAAAVALSCAWTLMTYLPGLLHELAPIAAAALAAWLCMEIARRHGLRLRGPHNAGHVSSTFGIIVTGWLGGLLATQLLTHLPAGTVMHGPQSHALGWTGTLIFPVANIAYTAVLEEIVMVAAVCLLGRAAGARPAAIYTVSLAVRIVAHAYFGLAALALAVLGTASVWLYRRYQRPVHLAAAHFALGMAPLAMGALHS